MKLHTPAMKFKDADAESNWNTGLANNNDTYGRGVYIYASEWATRMEVELAAGKKLADIAQKCANDADDEGITGFMYGCAVSILANCGVHGEELRRWHNKDTQLGTEGDAANESGGVLNPALINIGLKGD